MNYIKIHAPLLTCWCLIEQVMDKIQEILTATQSARFFQKVKKIECWIWMGYIYHNNGYGGFKYNGRRVKAHRLSYQIHRGPISDKQVLHNCDNPACVNPDHLYLGTPLENARDRDSRGRNGFSRKTHCKHGHEFTELNTYRHKGKRHCRTCRSKRPLPSPPHN